jgi:hypothetical protein
MTRKDFEERTRFEQILTEEAEAQNNDALPQWSRKQSALVAARLLCRHGKTYSRIQEAVCNGVEWSHYDTNESFNRRQAAHEAWTEKRETQLEKRIREIVAGIGVGFGVIFQGDPRGCTLKITVPSGRTNDFGKEGICVPGA